MSRMTPAERVFVILVLAVTILLGWATLSFVLGMRPTVGLFS